MDLITSLIEILKLILTIISNEFANRYKNAEISGKATTDLAQSVNELSREFNLINKTSVLPKSDIMDRLSPKPMFSRNFSFYEATKSPIKNSFAQSGR